MKGKRFSETQIIQILKEAEAGVAIPDLCRRYGFSKSSYYNMEGQIQRHGSLRLETNA